MKKTFAIVIILLVVILSCGTGPSNHDLSFKMTVSDPVNTMIPFAPGDYSMELERVSVMSGSNSGVEFSWTKDDGENKKLVFTIFLPSSEKFSVWNTSTEEVECSVPETPFELTEKDFDSVFSVRVHQQVHAYISLNRETQVMSDQTNVDYLTFSIFKLTMKEFSFKKNKITADCEFEASLSDEYIKYAKSDYSISGSFSLNNIQVGITLVDD